MSQHACTHTHTHTHTHTQCIHFPKHFQGYFQLQNVTMLHKWKKKRLNKHSAATGLTKKRLNKHSAATGLTFHQLEKQEQHQWL